MTTKKIINLEDIKLLVDTFYGRVQNDEMLGHKFNDAIGDRWEEHLEKMYRFWQTILLEEHTYSGSPFPPHMKLDITKEHFDQWLAIFTTTVHDLFEGELAQEAIWRGERMAATFHYKIEYHKNSL